MIERILFRKNSIRETACSLLGLSSNIRVYMDLEGMSFEKNVVIRASSVKTKGMKVLVEMFLTDSFRSFTSVHAEALNKLAMYMSRNGFDNKKIVRILHGKLFAEYLQKNEFKVKKSWLALNRFVNRMGFSEVSCIDDVINVVGSASERKAVLFVLTEELFREYEADQSLFRALAVKAVVQKGRKDYREFGEILIASETSNLTTYLTEAGFGGEVGTYLVDNIKDKNFRAEICDSESIRLAGTVDSRD